MAEGKPRTTAEIVTAITNDSGLPLESRALFLMMIDRAVGYLAESSERGATVIKFGHSHKAQWAIAPSLL